MIIRSKNCELFHLVFEGLKLGIYQPQVERVQSLSTPGPEHTESGSTVLLPSDCFQLQQEQNFAIIGISSNISSSNCCTNEVNSVKKVSHSYTTRTCTLVSHFGSQNMVPIFQSSNILYSWPRVKKSKLLTQGQYAIDLWSREFNSGF